VMSIVHGQLQLEDIDCAIKLLSACYLKDMPAALMPKGIFTNSPIEDSSGKLLARKDC
jgi:hypothetical protein